MNGPPSSNASQPEKRVLITGGTRGVGLGLASELLKRGCMVTVPGRNPQRLEQTLKNLGDHPGPGHVFGTQCEITEATQVQSLWDFAFENMGGMDVWISNAGMSIPPLVLWEQDPEKLRRIIDVNLYGAMLSAQVALKGFMDQGRGQLWNLEGFGARGMVQPGMAPYGATKYAVAYLHKTLLKETQATPVQVGMLSPGIVITDLLRGDYDPQSETWQRARRIFNILGDHVGTVTPFLVDGILRTRRTGARIAWLTQAKASWRFMSAPFRKRDLFGDGATSSPND
jgi:NAD(P)-dependent dehydrogenase (short-subunit alcohol dehydrogenase family)